MGDTANFKLNQNEIIKLILNLDVNERRIVYRELIKYCGSKDRVYIKEEIKKYSHKGTNIFPRIYNNCIIKIISTHNKIFIF